MASVARLQARIGRVYYGWWIILSTFVLGALSGGLFWQSNSIFFGPIKDDLRLNSARTSIIFATSRAEGSIAGPFVGRLVDVFGPRPMILAGGLMAGLGYVLLHRVDSYWVFLAIFVLVVSAGRSAGMGQTLLSAVNTWFVRQRSMAMSICITGFSSGGAVILPLVTLGVHSLGWRDVMLYSGIFMCIVVVPLAVVVRRSPESMGLLPDGDEPDQGPNHVNNATTGELPPKEAPVDFSVREALATGAYWVLLTATVLRIGLWGAVSLHMVEIFVWKGTDREMAGFLFSLLFFLSVPTRLGAGYLGDRLPIQPLLCASMALGGLATLCLLGLEGNLAVYVFVVLLALEQGGSTLNWVLLGNFFGRKSFATLMGIMSTCFNIGMLFTPIYAGWVFDTTDSYRLVLLTFTPFYGLAALFYLGVRRPQPPRRAADSPGGRATATGPGAHKGRPHTRG